MTGARAAGNNLTITRQRPEVGQENLATLAFLDRAAEMDRVEHVRPDDFRMPLGNGLKSIDNPVGFRRVLAKAFEI